MKTIAAVLGHPVRHSLSPAIHAAAARAIGIDHLYLQLAFPGERALDAVRALGLLDAVGASVTMPLKRAVVPHLDGLAPTAAALDAVNTITRAPDGTLTGHNTDGAGFVRFLRADASFEPRARRALVLGAGGAARAVAVALAVEGAAVTVAARRSEQARALAALAPGLQVTNWGTTDETDLIVNATPAREGLPLTELPFGPGVVAVDLIYPPPPTAFLQAARAAGAAAHDGLGMLIHQAALAFELWHGTAPPLPVMRAAAEAALETPG